MFRRLLVLIALLLISNLTQAEELVRIGLLDFSSKSGGQDVEWLSRGIPDLIIRELLPEARFQFVEREKLVELNKELDLAQSGFTTSTPLLSSAYDHLLTGTFSSSGTKIEIRYILLSAKSFKSQNKSVCTVSGELKDISVIVSRITKELIALGPDGILRCQNAPITPADVERGDNVEASALFYKALRLYDSGKYSEAQSLMVLSKIKAPQKEESILWSAKIDRELGEYEHAALQLEDALQSPHTPRYKFHYKLLLADIYRRYLNQPQKAADSLSGLTPVTIFDRSLVMLNQAESDLDAEFPERAFNKMLSLYRELYDFLENQHPAVEFTISTELRIPYGSIQMPSLYEIKDRALTGYREAYLRGRLIHKLEIKPLPGITLLTEDISQVKTGGSDLPFVYGETSGEVLFKREDRSLDKLILAPPGFYFGNIKLNLKSNEYKSSAGIYAYQEELSPNYNTTAYHCHDEANSTSKQVECDLSLFKVRAFRMDTHGNGPAKWTISYELIPEDKKRGFIWKGKYEGLLSDHLLYPKLAPIHVKEASNISLFLTNDNLPLVAFDSYSPMESETVDKSDLFITSGDSTYALEPGKRIENLSSSTADIYPSLLGDEKKLPLLFFASNRSGKFRIWLSRSRTGKRWNSPEQLNIPTSAHLKPDDGEYYVLSSLYDSTGVFQLLLFEKNGRRFVVSKSGDLKTWSIPIQIGETINDFGYPSGTIIQDSSGVFRALLSAPHSSSMPMQSGFSNDGSKWTFEYLRSAGNDSPRLNSLPNGNLAMIFGGGVSGKGLTQVISKDGRGWDKPIIFPNAELCGSLASTYYASADFKILPSGKILLVSRGYHSSVLSSYLLDTFPITDVFQAWKLADSVPRHLRLHLQRDQIYGNYHKSRSE